MSVAMSSPSLYGRPRTTMARRLVRPSLSTLPKGLPAKRETSTSSHVSSKLQRLRRQTIGQSSISSAVASPANSQSIYLSPADSAGGLVTRSGIPPQSAVSNSAHSSGDWHALPTDTVSSEARSAMSPGSAMSNAVSSTADSQSICVLPARTGSIVARRGTSLQAAVTKRNPSYLTRKNVMSGMSSVSSVTDEKYREALQRHFRLLRSKMALDDNVIKMMAEEKILPDSMIKDIQEAETREEKNEVLLKSLYLRGNKCYRHFRELMFRTGNYFIADLLWDEGEQPGSLEEEDFKKFPGLLGGIPEAQRRRLMLFLEAKIREKALQLAWKTSPEERMQILNSKVTGFQTEKALRETIAAQERKILELRNSVQKGEENCRIQKMELSTQQQLMSQMKKDQLFLLQTQTRCHDANLSTIARLKEQQAKAKENVMNLNETLQRKLDLMPNESDAEGRGDHGLDEEIKVDSLERNVGKLLAELKHEKARADQGDAQRQEVLKLLNRRYTKEPLVTVVKDVLKHEQRHRSLVMRDLLSLAHILKQMGAQSSDAAMASTLSLESAKAAALSDPSSLDTKHFKAQLGMLKAEAEHIYKRFQWKDAQIAEQQKDIQSLRRHLRQPSHRSQSDGPSTNSPQITPVDSPSQQSLLQPFSSPLDPVFLGVQEEEEDDSSSPTLEPQRTTTPRGSDCSGRSPSKTVTFKERNHAGHLSPKRPRAGRSRSSLHDWPPRPDPDKTLVNVDQYLLADMRAEDDEEVPYKSPPSRGEGDINDSHQQHGRGSTGVGVGGAGVGYTARTKKAVHKWTDVYINVQKQ